MTNLLASQQPAPKAWEEALREWWRTGVLNPKIIAVEDAFKAGWDARAALSTPLGTPGKGEKMSEYLGKAHVLAKWPEAWLDRAFDGGLEICVWDGDDCLILGRGKNPEDAWHDAAVDIGASLGTPGRDKP